MAARIVGGRSSLTDMCTHAELMAKVLPVTGNSMQVRRGKVEPFLECPICRGIMKEPVMIKQCLHRFCKECLEQALRTLKNECPLCRTRVPSRRSLERDSRFEAIIALLYKGEEEYDAKQQSIMEEAVRASRASTAAIANAAARARGSRRDTDAGLSDSAALRMQQDAQLLAAAAESEAAVSQAAAKAAAQEAAARAALEAAAVKAAAAKADAAVAAATTVLRKTALAPKPSAPEPAPSKPAEPPLPPAAGAGREPAQSAAPATGGVKRPREGEGGDSPAQAKEAKVARRESDSPAPSPSPAPAQAAAKVWEEHPWKDAAVGGVPMGAVKFARCVEPTRFDICVVSGQPSVSSTPIHQIPATTPLSEIAENFTNWMPAYRAEVAMMRKNGWRVGFVVHLRSDTPEDMLLPVELLASERYQGRSFGQVWPCKNEDATLWDLRLLARRLRSRNPQLKDLEPTGHTVRLQWMYTRDSHSEEEQEEAKWYEHHLLVHVIHKNAPCKCNMHTPDKLMHLYAARLVPKHTKKGKGKWHYPAS